MDNEKPRKFSSDPRIYPAGFIKDWEEGVTDEDRAETVYAIFQKRLKEANITIPVDAKVLEIGSGRGVFLRYLQKLGFDAVGVDARPRGEQDNKVVRARVEQLPFPDESFNLIFSNAVFDRELYHQDQLAMVKEIVRVLKHGGIYYGLLNDGETPLEESLEVLGGNFPIGSGIYRKK